MIKIAIIEDELDMCHMIQRNITSIEDIYNMVEIFSYDTAESFIKELKNGLKIDIVLCDIELPEMNGIELGRFLRIEYPEIHLIYLTSHAQFAVESYYLDAYQYILKKDMCARFSIVLGGLVKKLKEEEKKHIIVGNSLNKRKIFYKNIVSITKEKGAKYVLFSTLDGEFRERSTLEEILKKIQSNEFILVERGYVVNMKHIVKMSGNMIWLDNGEQVDISRARMMKIKKMINTYWRDC